MRTRLRAPSPALVISLVALFVALGGTGYAALRLPRNSVGTVQLQNNSVIAPKIRNGTIVGSKIMNGAVTAGKINPKGLTVPNATHATIAVSAQIAATATTAATAATATTAGTATTASSPGTLASGKTETGVYDVDFVAQTGDLSGNAAISFPFPLAVAPTVAWVTPGSPASQCPGSATTPQAAPGYLCIYVSSDENVNTYSAAPSFTYAATPQITAKAAGRTDSVGTWALTAP
jgi:hypothetical protein